MPDVTGTLQDPTGEVLASTPVEFELVDQAGVPLRRGWLAATNKTIVGEKTVTTNVSGVYTVTLPANTDVTPADSRWRRRILPVDGARAVDDLLVVPAGAGPYTEDDIVVDPAPLVTPAAQPGGKQLAAWQLAGTANTAVSTTSTVAAAIAGLGGTIETSGRPIAVHLNMSWVTVSDANKTGTFTVKIDGTEPKGGARLVRSKVVGEALHVDLWVPAVPAAGEHTVTVEWAAGEAGTTLSFYPESLLGVPCLAACEVFEW